MKKSELRKIIKEEIKKSLKEGSYTPRGGRIRSVDDEGSEVRRSVSSNKRKEQIWDNITRAERLGILKDNTSVDAEDYDLYANMDYDELPSGLLSSWEV
jgi:hypothetical protein